MSAHRVSEQTVHNEAAGTVTYAFRQPVCMPSYLLAFAVGALESRQIGPRSVVWSEKVCACGCLLGLFGFWILGVLFVWVCGVGVLSVPRSRIRCFLFICL
jgi:hypothetical protein